jgi:hypothetical protein
MTCRDGKLNPPNLVDAVEVAQHLGPRSICMMNEFREQVLDIWQGNLLEGKPPRRPHEPLRRWTLEI